MSQRSLTRAHQRRTAAEQRRAALLRRRLGLAAGAAVGVAAAAAPAAQAATFEVNTTADSTATTCGTAPGACTLRGAIAQADGSADAQDTITFASSVTGTITLTQGQLALGPTSGAVVVQGPGRDVLTVSGDANANAMADSGDSRVFAVTGSQPVVVSGLTLSRGDVAAGSGASGGFGAGDGGAILNTNANLGLVDDAVVDSTAGTAGGAVASDGGLTLVRTSVARDTAPTGGGIATLAAAATGPLSSSAGGPLVVTDSQVTGDSATNGAGGGLAVTGPLTMSGTIVSGDSATTSGGGIARSGSFVPLNISASTISGNTASRGGGLSLASGVEKYENRAVASTITQTTIAQNTLAAGGTGGAGVAVGGLAGSDRLTIDRSTISANTGPTGSAGGGVLFDGEVDGTFALTESTISGNTADVGGGVAFGRPAAGGVPTFRSDVPPSLANSTVSANAAATRGGGLYLGQYAATAGGDALTVDADSTIVAGNTAAGAANDLARSSAVTRGGGLSLAYSLLQTPAQSGLVSSTPAGSSLIGVDPLLGPLASNGGSTQTQLPALGSPVVDKGKAPARDLVDQRGLARTVDGDAANAAGGDATDIGAVERPEGLTPVVTPTPPAAVVEDAPPTVAFSAPTAGSTLSAAAPTTIAATAADDRGVAKVVFLIGDRVVCTDTTAPFSCAYAPQATDVGRDTLVAIAFDAANQTATALRTVQLGRFTPTLSVATTPKRTSSQRVGFTTTGKLKPPAGVSTKLGCSGVVTVTVKSASRTISTRRATVTKACAYSSQVSLTLPTRRSARRLRVVATYGGNDVLLTDRVDVTKTVR